MAVDACESSLSSRNVEDRVPHASTMVSKYDGDSTLVGQGDSPTTCPPATDHGNSEVGDVDSDGDACADKLSHIFEREETVIIFDWDDTVLPSSWVQKQGLNLDGEVPLSSSQKEDLAELCKNAAATISLAKQCGYYSYSRAAL